MAEQQGKHLRRPEGGHTSTTDLHTLPKIELEDETQSQDATESRKRTRASKKESKSQGTAPKLRRAISNILLIVGLALLAYSGYLWWQAHSAYQEVDEINEKLAAYAEVSDDEISVPEVDWAGLKEINDDVVGWIQIPGTVINYPIYQGTDNDYYLNTNAEGVYGIGGQIFLDYEATAPGMVDPQTIIYGHHMKNGAMFKQVADMDNQQFFDSIHTVWYVTEDAAYELMPLFVYHTDPNDTNVRIFDFESPDAVHQYLAELMAAKGITKNPDAERIINGTTHFLTLSTCNYIEGSGRTMLVCVEKEEADRVLNPVGP